MFKVYVSLFNVAGFFFMLPEFNVFTTEVEVATAPITRGHSKGIPEWNTGVKIDIKFDSSFQPVGDRATQLKSQLGQIVRDGHRIPLTIIDWKAVGNDVKEGIWTEVKVYIYIHIYVSVYVYKYASE